jgi:uncharacterized protein (TIGR02391 family)
MIPKANPKLAAINIGDSLKNDTTVNEISRTASGVFPFTREQFPSEAITSTRAALIYEWLMTLFKQECSDDEKRKLLRTFLHGITPVAKRPIVQEILQECGILLELKTVSEDEKEFDNRRFYAEINKHSRDLFLIGQHFHAVFEAAKAFNAAVKQKSGLLKLDGQGLMNKAFSSQTPLIKITRCTTETEKNIQDGYRFIADGLMSAIRNPTAHEPARSFPIGREDALDILSLISYLFRWLDKAVVQKENS